MRGLFVIAAVLLVLSSFSSAEFNLAPYMYASEKDASVEYPSFASNNSTVKIVKIGGIESLVLQDEALVTDSAQVSALLREYYTRNFYPSQEDMQGLRGDIDAFNKSRDYMSRYGPVERTCVQYTFLAYKPCKDLTSCTQTASLVCTISGADGCMIDVLAPYILDYQKALDKLNSGYAKFASGYNNFGPNTVAVAIADMEFGTVTMKEGADAAAKSKLRFPEGGVSCMDCVGLCPEQHFDYAALQSGKDRIAEIKAKTEPFGSLDTVVARVTASTEERMAFRQGEEKALIFSPKLKSRTAKFAGLKSQAVEAKALVSDSSFVTAADSFLNSGDELEQKFAKREFDGFDSLLSAYETSGRTLEAMINNSTAAYRVAFEAQDAASDRVLEAQWSVNRLSKASVDSYNSLADRKNKLDSQFKPPQTSAQYYSLADGYRKVTSDTSTYLAASSSVQSSIFSAGNALGRTSVDGAMSLVSSMTPVSFKTRKSVATFVPPLVLAVIDLSVLAVALIVFVGLFYYFRGFFRSKIAASGWALTFLFFVFVLIVGSGAFYAIVLTQEQYTTFADFFGTFKSSGAIAVVVEESGAPAGAVENMRTCAAQIETQAAALGKKTYKYYVGASKCTSVVPRTVAANNSTSAYETNQNLLASNCLDKMPDVPVFDLYYSAENKVPVFTTVVTRSATFKYNEAAYGTKPMCPVANILG